VYEENRIKYMQAVRQGFSGEQQPSLLPKLQKKGSAIQAAAGEDAAKPPLLPED
jgi:hypothetical protein